MKLEKDHIEDTKYYSSATASFESKWYEGSSWWLIVFTAIFCGILFTICLYKIFDVVLRLYSPRREMDQLV